MPSNEELPAEELQLDVWFGLKQIQKLDYYGIFNLINSYIYSII